MILEKSEALDKIAPAIIKVQQAVSGVEKNGTNPHFKSRYSDLTAANAASRDPLTENGLSVTQWPGAYNGEDRTMGMTTLLLHASGQFLCGTLTIPLSKVDPQGYGACVTYARRYALMAALGLSPEDDDGNLASQKTPANEQSVGTISERERSALLGLLEAAPVSAGDICQAYKIKDLRELPATAFGAVKKRIEEKMKEAA